MTEENQQGEGPDGEAPQPIIVTVHHPDGSTTSQYCYPTDTGAARCGYSFNPGENEDVKQIKGLAAGLMQRLASQHGLCMEEKDFEGARCFATAMTQLESAQMFAVKGLFAKRNAGK